MGQTAGAAATFVTHFSKLVMSALSVLVMCRQSCGSCVIMAGTVSWLALQNGTSRLLSLRVKTHTSHVSE
jgi:hypothetical protein